MVKRVLGGLVLLAAIGAGCRSNGVDESALPLGSGKYSSEPKDGYIYSCSTRFGGGGAQVTGEWIDEVAGTWDPSGKPAVDGNVTWDAASVTFAIEGDRRMITGNGLPVEDPTGEFPISSTDDAYQYDRNPNSIEEQALSLDLPTNPAIADEPSCVPMDMIGVALNGVAIYNGFDAQGRDAVAYEIQDECEGHPERSGEYHYHNVSSCLDSDEHTLVAYMLDGFGLYGLTDSDDLDECRGHAHEIEWDGETVDMYHYHASEEFPYTIGCFAGELSD